MRFRFDPLITKQSLKHGNEHLVSQNGLLPVAINLAERFKNLPDVHCVDSDISQGEVPLPMLEPGC